MISGIVLIIIILAILYFLYVNNKLNLDSFNESSPNLSQNSDSLQMDQAGQFSVKLKNSKIKSLRILHGENKMSKIYVSERPLTFAEIIDEGNRMIGTNCVFVGTLTDPAIVSQNTVNNISTSASSTSSQVVIRSTANFDIKQFKNIFIVFKNLEHNKIKETINVLRYEADGMVYFFVDNNANNINELREVSYPVVVYTNNVNAQLKLNEWDYTQINENATLFIKNAKSFRIQ
ncbi:ODV-E25 [Urbanus proteus nucleopolyhedrovirus]|uniref:ODV-E25 n=1 Tax=Urbanus proteus nucleopolyhedrovirus TaxID=1675866 RepID=A0A161CCY9_9ABAC|nr:ODV-E25 [Urbanus proteus nucleopolyhedrovirus]AKR17311.1 ODV-E25 [Urbanus proteus nucleopolyhedrovirus]